MRRIDYLLETGLSEVNKKVHKKLLPFQNRNVFVILVTEVHDSALQFCVALLS